MARHIGWALVAVLASGPLGASADSTPSGACVAAQPERAQGRQDKRGDSPDRRLWWKNPHDMAEIGLTAEQSAKIDAIFRGEIDKMKQMRTQVNELERGVDAAMRANTADIAAFARQVEQVEHKRAELNKTRTVMLYRMHRVLTPEQHTKFRAMWDRREADRKKQESERRR